MYLNLFYEEPDPDRWIGYDRYPRRWVRRLIRGKQRPGGVMMVALELMRGLDALNIPYRFNNYAHARKNPHELIGVVGKPHLIFQRKFKNPILFGAGVYSHPVDCPELFSEYPNVQKMLVPGKWMEDMCRPYYGDKVEHWPVGIDTKKWNQEIKSQTPETDVLIYDKIRWHHEQYEANLIRPIVKELEQRNLKYDFIRYGQYNHTQLIEKVAKTKSVIFLCEHETQGLAYQQILATGTPIFAWDRGGYWQDPEYYPHRAVYEPVSSVPYWDHRCGMKFKDFHEFVASIENFMKKVDQNTFMPRKYILENLTLEHSAIKYLQIYQKVSQQL